MSKQIQIVKNGTLEKTLDLENGTYILGRAADADIVLADSAVSKTHATLTINDEMFHIKDSSSANGIFFQGKKCTEKTFDNNFEIEIKPFIIRTAVDDSPENEAAQAAGVDAVRNFSINNIKISIFLLFSIIMLLTVLIGYLPLKQKTASIVRQEKLKTGILLARYLAEINRPFLEEGQHTLIRTSPVRMEDGVVYAFVLDQNGRIIAPLEKQGDFIDWNGLSSAFAGAKLKIEDGKQNEKIIFYPVIQQNQTIGAAIIGFAWQQTGTDTISGMGAMAICLIAILFGIGFAMAHLLGKAFLNPLKSLYEEVEIAIKNGKMSLDYQAPYAELENLKRAFDRLLARKTSSSPSLAPDTRRIYAEKSESPPNSSEKPAQKSTAGKSPEPTTPSVDKQLQGLTAPWCVIDRENYTVLRFSDNFIPGPGTPECAIGMHIIEALETDIIPAVSQMIDSEADTDQTVMLGRKRYKLKRINDASEVNRVTLVFEDNSE